MHDDRIKGILSDALKTECEKLYTTSARGSNLPICKLDLLLHYYCRKYNKLPKVKTTFKQEYYLDVGNTLHDLFQKWITYAYYGKVFALWKCPDCGETTLGFGPIYCAKCNKICSYEEIEVSDRGFSGHIDMIIDLFDNGKLWVIDFKFLTKPQKEKVWTYELQVNSYMAVLKNMGYPIEGGMIWHFCREDAFNFEKARFYTVDFCSELHESGIKEVEEFENFIKFPDYNNIPKGLCTCSKDIDDMYCLWGKICGSPISESLIRDIIINTK